MNTEQTKKCRECQSDIPKKARRCPNCRTKQGIGLGGLIVAVVFIIITISMVSSSLEDSSPAPVDTFVPRVVESTFELGTYKVEAEDFDQMATSEVNLWRSYSDRKKLGAVTRGDIVEVISHDAPNEYCKVSAGDQTGWLACGWLVKQ